MLKKIKVSHLKIGMYVADTGLSWIDYPFLYSKPGLVRTSGEIRRMLDEGFREVFIDTEKGTGDAPESRADLDELRIGQDQADAPQTSAPSTQPGRPTESLGREMVNAKRIYKESLRFASDFFRQARTGQPLDIQSGVRHLREVMGSLTRNQGAITGLSKLREYDEYTFTHSINVAILAMLFGQHLHLPEEDVLEIGMAGLFHDVGKALIPASILNKPGRLTPAEFEIIKNHPGRGHDILRSCSGISERILNGVAEHHEKYDGSGYPGGRCGEEIGEFARVLNIVDVYDALTSDRIYKKAMPPTKALRLMFGLREQDFYPEYLEKFIKCVGIYPVGTCVRLSTGDHGFVAEAVPGMPLMPKVLVALNHDLRPIPQCRLEDLSLQREMQIEDSVHPLPPGIDPVFYLSRGC